MKDTSSKFLKMLLEKSMCTQKAQKNSDKTLMMIDGALLEKRQFAEGEFEAFLPFKVQFELELESNYFSTTLSNFAVNQLIYQLN